MTTLGRGMGLLVEDEETAAQAQVARPLHALVGGARPGAGTTVLRPARVSYASLLTALDDGILDQGETSQCVGCTFSTCAYLRGLVSNHRIPRPSSKLFYDLARLFHGDSELVDEGCLPLDAVDAAAARGLVAMRDWPMLAPADDAMRALIPKGKTWIDTPPDLAVYRKAIDARVLGYLRADDGDVVAQLEAALAIGQIPGFGMFVFGDYGDVRGDVYDFPPNAKADDAEGAHMQPIVGYDEVAFEIATSWGRGHGVNGIVRIAKAALGRRDLVFSRTIVTTAPGKLAA